MKTILALLCLCSCALARVGETYRDFLKRTGFASTAKPTGMRDVFTASHEKNLIFVNMTVFNGVICMEARAVLIGEPVPIWIMTQVRFSPEENGDHSFSVEITDEDGAAIYRKEWNAVVPIGEAVCMQYPFQIVLQPHGTALYSLQFQCDGQRLSEIPLKVSPL